MNGQRMTAGKTLNRTLPIQIHCASIQCESCCRFVRDNGVKHETASRRIARAARECRRKHHAADLLRATAYGGLIAPARGRDRTAILADRPPNGRFRDAA